MELEVIWNGAVDGPNRGMLCVASQESRPAPAIVHYIPVDPKRGLEPLVRTALQSGDWWTVAEIAQRVGVGRTSAGSVIRRLLKRQLIEVGGEAHKPVYRWKPVA